MSPFRQEIREFIRASERILSLESFDTPLTEEERGAVLLLIEYLTKNLPRPSVIRPMGTTKTTAMTERPWQTWDPPGSKTL